MSSENNDQHLMLLGEIKGIVQGLRDGQQAQADQLRAVQEGMGAMDGRLRTVEQGLVRVGAQAGAVSGGAMAIGVALIVETLKAWVGKGTPHP